MSKEITHMSYDTPSMSPGSNRPFEGAVNIAEYFPIILREYQKIIDADLPIEKGYLNEANEIHFWRLPNIALPLAGEPMSTQRVNIEKYKITSVVNSKTNEIIYNHRLTSLLNPEDINLI